MLEVELGIGRFLRYADDDARLGIMTRVEAMVSVRFMARFRVPTPYIRAILVLCTPHAYCVPRTPQLVPVSLP